jgi:SOS-response transcriptional repressor LexA
VSKKYLNLSRILKNLLFQKDMRPVDLAREIGMPLPTIHRIVTGKSSRPYESSLRPIADFFGISIKQLSGETPLESGTSFNTLPINHPKFFEIPHLEWEELAEIGQIKKNKTLAVTTDLSDNCFALTMNDSSMTPLFPKGSILILDPNKKIWDRTYVLVKMHGSNVFVFRQLIVGGEYQFIKSLNPDLQGSQLRMLDSSDTVIASLVESRFVYHDQMG